MGNRTKIQLIRYLFLIAFVLLAAGAAMSILPLQRQYAKQRAELELLQQEADARRAKRNALSREVADLENSPQAIERVAREKFGLCREGETILKYTVPELP